MNSTVEGVRMALDQITEEEVNDYLQETDHL